MNHKLTALTFDHDALSKLNHISTALHGRYSWPIPFVATGPASMVWASFASACGLPEGAEEFAFPAIIAESQSKAAAALIELVPDAARLRVIPAWLRYVPVTQRQGATVRLYASRANARVATESEAAAGEATNEVLCKTEAVLLVAPIGYQGLTRGLDVAAKDLAPVELNGPEFSFGTPADAAPVEAKAPAEADKVSLPPEFVRPMKHLAKLASAHKPKAAERLKRKINPWLTDPKVVCAMRGVKIK